MWLCLGPLGLHQGWGSHGGSPTHEHTDPAAGLSFLEMPWAFRGDTHHLACHVPAGSLEAPLLARMNARWTCRRITWEEMGAHQHPAFSSSSSLVSFAFF